MKQPRSRMQPRGTARSGTSAASGQSGLSPRKTVTGSIIPSPRNPRTRRRCASGAWIMVPVTVFPLLVAVFYLLGSIIPSPRNPRTRRRHASTATGTAYSASSARGTAYSASSAASGQSGLSPLQRSRTNAAPAQSGLSWKSLLRPGIQQHAATQHSRAIFMPAGAASGGMAQTVPPCLPFFRRLYTNRL